MTISGTKEWAEHSLNIIAGCSHNCRYCYAKAMAIRFGRATHESWPVEIANWKAIDKKRIKKKGRIMFPTTHDITPSNVHLCVKVLNEILKAGNEILIVSKPHWDCIVELCDRYAMYKDRITFRFTIGSPYSTDTNYWEPGAPDVSERIRCLDYAHFCGYKTSVSCEPLLCGVDNCLELIGNIEYAVTDSIWIGKMNNIASRVRIESPKDIEQIKRIEEMQTDKKIKELYNALKGNPKVKWKESIKKVVGLELANKPGMDI